MKIIADACLNHLNNKDIIEKMIEEASSSMVDIIKFQLYKSENLSFLWLDKYNYYYKYKLSVETCEYIVDECRQKDIEVLFTLFDFSCEDILHNLKLNKVKIGSAEACHVDKVLALANRFDTVFVSCGMISQDIIKIYRKVHNIKLFYCVSKYPVQEKDIDFDLMQSFDGFSDHTSNINCSLKALTMGMEYIERHYTLGKFLPGNDHKISSTPDEFKELTLHRDYLINLKKYKKRWRNDT